MKNCFGAVLRFGVAVAALCVPAFAGIINPTPAPEPVTIALVAGGIAAVAGVRYVRSRKR